MREFTQFENRLIAMFRERIHDLDYTITNDSSKPIIQRMHQGSKEAMIKTVWLNRHLLKGLFGIDDEE